MPRRSVLGSAGVTLAATMAGRPALAKQPGTVVAATVDALVAAVADPATSVITVEGRLAGVPQLRLREGQALLGRDGGEIRFASGIDGLCLSTDNTVSGLRLLASPDKRAAFNDTGVSTLAQLRLHGLQTTGQVQILLRDAVRAGFVEAADVLVEAADVRDRPDRPAGFGVQALQGAFTLWNQQADPAVTVGADLSALRAGRAEAPVRGSGIFVAGQPNGGIVRAARIETGAVHSDGGIVPGTRDRITAGVFVLHGTEAELVRNIGAVTTYGANDMVLNNWGSVAHWIAEAAVTSFGASSTCVVNFGTLAHLEVQASVESHGGGARGFNVYAGTVEFAEFFRIVTHGDGAIGMQIGQPVGRIHVRNGIETYGAKGPSLVKGALVPLSALALSILPGGSAREILVDGGLVTHGAGVPATELLGSVERLAVSGGVGSAVRPG